VIRHEALINLALTGPVHILCPYHASLPTNVIACAQATHPLAGRHGRWQPSPRYQHLPGDPLFPPECDQPLPAPPGSASAVPYYQDLASVRSLVSDRALAAGLPRQRASDLLIAVGELIANTRVHTSGPGLLTVWSTRTEVTCQVADAGQITNPLAGQLRPGPDAEGGGRGLWVVHQLCDLVQVRTNQAGTTIRIHMRLRG
jgi:anti-sigma regulatory factor (Ser/Thr protein kinase)